MMKCEVCSSTNIVEEREEYVCHGCGACQKEKRMDTRKEWREFEDDDQNSERIRTERADEEFHTLGTEITPDEHGRGAALARALNRVSRLVPTGDLDQHLLKTGYAGINDLSEKLNLSDQQKNTAKEILRILFSKQKDQVWLQKAVKKQEFLSAVVLVACKYEFGGRTLKTIAQTTQLPESKVKRFYKKLVRDSSMFREALENGSTEERTIKEVLALVQAFCSLLQLKNAQLRMAIEHLARGIAESAVSFLEGRRPSSIAAASIFLALHLHNLRYTRQDMAEIASISPNTLGNTYKELTENLDKIPPQFLQVNSFGATISFS